MSGSPNLNLMENETNSVSDSSSSSNDLLALPPASLTHKNPQRRHGMRPVECKDRSIDLKMFL